MALDISKLALEPTATVQLKHPITGDLLFDTDASGNDVAVNVRLYGKASTQYRNAETAQLNRMLKRQASARATKLDADDLRDEGTEVLLAAVAGFDNFEFEGVIPTTKDDYRKLLSNPTLPWLRKQIEEGLADDSNFLAR